MNQETIYEGGMNCRREQREKHKLITKDLIHLIGADLMIELDHAKQEKI